MDLREIKEVIKLMKTNDITDFELEKEGFKIVLRKEKEIVSQKIIEPVSAYYHQPPMVEMAQSFKPNNSSSALQEKAVSKEEVEDESITYILSPMVGTFYGAPSPDSPPYVKTGQEVKADDVVCILEAMKVFNEIKAELEGKIVEVLVENGSPVEYGQKLFKIQKSKR